MPFKRVREEDVEVDPRLVDNSFEAKVSCSPICSIRRDRNSSERQCLLLLLRMHSVHLVYGPRYLGFLMLVPTNAKVFLHGLWL